MNQCDGCRRGVPVDANNNHKIDDYKDALQRCTKDRYEVKTVHDHLIRLWDKNVGTKDYKKGEWRLLEAILQRGLTLTTNIPEDLRGSWYE